MPEILETYGNVTIVDIGSGNLPLYSLKIPNLTNDEKSVIENPKKLVALADIDKLDAMSFTKRDKFLRQKIKEKIIEALDSGKNIKPENMEILISLAISEFYGYDVIGPLMEDDRLEEVMVNGVNLPIIVFHRSHGMCTTNLGFKDRESLNGVINKIAEYAGRRISKNEPLLDAQLPDGSRSNVAIPPAAPKGPVITIRKFRAEPFSIIDLIIVKTITVELAAFLWTAVEGFGISPINMLITGGAGSGKTTTLNSLGTFIPLHERIVTVEDTMELNFDFTDNWVPLEATPSVIKESTIDTEALMKNTLRMRPDRVIVGEVRGAEAVTLFVAMDIGLNGSMGTIHANNSRECAIRLEDPPMSVPLMMLPLLDLIVVQNRIFAPGKGVIRRITEVTEVGGVQNKVLQLGEIYKWDQETDEIKRTPYPVLMKEKLAKNAGMSKLEFEEELKDRQRVLQYLVDNNIRANDAVIDYVRRYRVDKKSVMEEMGPEDLYEIPGKK